MAATPERPGRLIVTADDWGYCERYNAGIEQAARAGAIDAVSAMVLRPDCDPAIAASGVEVGLHLELPDGSTFFRIAEEESAARISPRSRATRRKRSSASSAARPPTSTVTTMLTRSRR